MQNILEKLNPPQLEAVTTTEGPILVIAGAGSGKTRALTHRVAYLIREKKINPRQILAVTFTNKAASEMKERIEELLATAEEPRKYDDTNANDYVFGNKNYSLPAVGTFHSICVKILRREIEKVGMKSSFNIFDTQDQLSLMKKTMREMEINLDQFKPQGILGEISKAKNELMNDEMFATQVGGYWEEMVSKIYSRYQKKLQKQNALDFDDILILTVKIFRTFPKVLAKYQNLWRYIMVDEYQDTNHAQYALVKMLAEKHKNLCVVGDDWQGIYSWRGANIQNILDFEKDYPSAKVIMLEQNYRSTQNILDAAYGVISKNINRKDKKVWTQNQGGHLLTSFEAQDEKEESAFIIDEISSLHRRENMPFSDFVILYRTNAQSRVLEEAMLSASIPYRIIGGVKFYARKEIKDIISYLRLIQNHTDEVSLERIINEPRRGIGEVTLSKWLKFAKLLGLDLINAGLNWQKLASTLITQEATLKLPSAKIEAISNFCEFIQRISRVKNNLTLTDLIQKVFSESGYEKFLTDGSEEGEMKLENVRELLTVAKKFDKLENEEALNLFLEEVALIADTDNINQSTDAVHLMTLHSAKGLEFKYVFIVGLEESILPHSRSMLSQAEMEEERRLMYVGITRAKKKVYLLFTTERNIFGSTQINAPSRFLDDIPEHLVQNYESEIMNQKEKTSENNLPTSKSILHNSQFKDGDHVRHEIFGDGMIVASQGDIITIAFKKAGLKKISVSLAPLKKLT